MKFPVTRQSLQKYDIATEDLLNTFCKEFEQYFRYSKEKKFAWMNLQHRLSMHQREKNPDCLPRFIQRLKETFVGCDIIVDPLKTYIIVDWS